MRRKWQDDHEIVDFMRVAKPKYIVYSPEGRLGPALKLDLQESSQERRGLRLERLFSTKHYIIYELETE